MELLEQVARFSEDVTMAILGSCAGMIYSSAFAVMALEFLYRNWGIVADHFGDTETVAACATAVKAIHTKNSTEKNRDDK